ncbi:MAG: helix-turn-helix transcriptional regulator, partial [Anaerotignum sp.]|nr:helix-turn-helix transcriptional regulator [Anaerotignum sp.]
MPETTAISEYLKAFRSEKNLNQTEFAKEIGFSRAELSLIERELVDPRLKTLKKIADYMGISISKLLQVETDGTETYS